MHYNDPQVRAMVLKLRKRNMLYTREQAAEYLGISPRAVTLLVESGQMTPANADLVNQARDQGRKVFVRFGMDELRRYKKVRLEEEQKKEEERKKAEEAARLKEEERRKKNPAEGVPVSMSGVTFVSAVDLKDLKARLERIETFMTELKPFMERLDKAML